MAEMNTMQTAALNVLKRHELGIKVKSSRSEDKPHFALTVNLSEK